METTEATVVVIADINPMIKEEDTSHASEISEKGRVAMMAMIKEGMHKTPVLLA